MHWRCASCRSFEETLHCDRCVSMVCADRDDLQSRIDRALELLNETGEVVDCSTCQMTKKPIGRSAAFEAANSYCDDDCPGYRLDPKPTSLWPGERRWEFGYGADLSAIRAALLGTEGE